MKLREALDEFYYEMMLQTLKQMNKGQLYGNLTYNSLLYLEIILYNEKCTPSFLAETLHVARSAVTVKINELVSKGLVFKIPCESDKRVTYLQVSSEVAEDYQLMNVPFTKAMEEIDAQYSDAEISSFIKMLAIIKKHHNEQ